MLPSMVAHPVVPPIERLGVHAVEMPQGFGEIGLRGF